jgi:5-methylcytosine-specific restriction enzyme A
MQRTTRRPRIATLAPSITIADIRTARPAPKRADPHYQDPKHIAWRATVIQLAGGRCEDIDERTGQRCEASEATGHRMFADHVHELRDGGAPFDPLNGMCRCGRHHTLKTNAERARRHAERG